MAHNAYQSHSFRQTYVPYQLLSSVWAEATAINVWHQLDIAGGADVDAR